MNREDKLQLAIWTTMSFIIATTIIICMGIYNKKQVSMARLGYEESTVVGSNSTVWVKCKNDSIDRDNAK